MTLGGGCTDPYGFANPRRRTQTRPVNAIAGGSIRSARGRVLLRSGTSVERKGSASSTSPRPFAPREAGTADQRSRQLSHAAEVCRIWGEASTACVFVAVSQGGESRPAQTGHRVAPWRSAAHGPERDRQSQLYASITSRFSRRKHLGELNAGSNPVDMGSAESQRKDRTIEPCHAEIITGSPFDTRANAQSPARRGGCKSRLVNDSIGSWQSSCRRAQPGGGAVERRTQAPLDGRRHRWRVRCSNVHRVSCPSGHAECHDRSHLHQSSL